MPEADGYAVLATLRADATLATVPFIFLTAKGTRSEMSHGMNPGADDYIAKPFTAAELIDAITARLQRAAAHTGVPSFTPQRLERLGLTAREAGSFLARPGQSQQRHRRHSRHGHAHREDAPRPHL